MRSVKRQVCELPYTQGERTRKIPCAAKNYSTTRKPTKVKNQAILSMTAVAILVELRTLLWRMNTTNTTEPARLAISESHGAAKVSAAHAASREVGQRAPSPPCTK